MTFNQMDVLLRIPQPPPQRRLRHARRLQRLCNQAAVHAVIAVIRGCTRAVQLQHRRHLPRLCFNEPFNTVLLLPMRSLIGLFPLQARLCVARTRLVPQLLPQLVHAELKPRHVHRLHFLQQLFNSLRLQIQIHSHRHKRDQSTVHNLHATPPSQRPLNKAARQPQKLLLSRILRKLRNVSPSVHSSHLNHHHHRPRPPLLHPAVAESHVAFAGSAHHSPV